MSSVSKQDPPSKEGKKEKTHRANKAKAKPPSLRWNESLYYVPEDVMMPMTYYTCCNCENWNKAIVTSKEIEFFPATVVGEDRDFHSDYEYSKEPNLKLQEWSHLWVGRGLSADGENICPNWTIGNGLIIQVDRTVYHVDGAYGDEKGQVPTQFVLNEKEKVEQAQSVVGSGESVNFLIQTNQRYFGGTIGYSGIVELDAVNKNYFGDKYNADHFTWDFFMNPDMNPDA